MSTSTRPRIAARLERPDYAALVLAVVFVWGAGDLFSTFAALHYTGVWGEANPLIRALLVYDPLLVVALKGAVMLLVGLVLLEYRAAVERLPRWRLWLTGLVGVGTTIVGFNLSVALVAATV